MKKLLTIAVTSYNRVNELIRCLESIDCEKHIDEIEVIISEDKSPKRNEIEKAVEEFKKKTKYEIVFHKNDINLGYDRNLKQLINLASSKYVLYISDDDMFLPGKIDHFVDVLSNKECALCYSPCFDEEHNRYARYYEKSFDIDRGSQFVRKKIYDSILFSGLIFELDKVRTIDAERFLNMNYIQVYMFIHTLYKYGGYYDNEPLIWIKGDGENGYGQSESSIKNELLANRKHALSNLEFHKGLINVIKMADADLSTKFIKDFEKEYSRRSIVGMLNAALDSKETLRAYWKKMKSLDLNLTIIARLYYCFLSVFGGKFTNNIITCIKKINCIKGLKYE